MFFKAMADAIASPEGLHDGEEEEENKGGADLRGHFGVDEEEPIGNPEAQRQASSRVGACKRRVRS